MNEPTLVFLFYGVLGVIAWLSQSLHNERKRREKAEESLKFFEAFHTEAMREKYAAQEEQIRLATEEQARQRAEESAAQKERMRLWREEQRRKSAQP